MKPHQFLLVILLCGCTTNFATDGEVDALTEDTQEEAEDSEEDVFDEDDGEEDAEDEDVEEDAEEDAIDVEDAAEDVVGDAREDTEDATDEDTVGDDAGVPCVYPSSPYDLSVVGDTIAPMAWPAAIAGAGETLPLADLEDIFCNPSVESVFILVTSAMDPYSPDKVRDIAAMKSTWATYGAVWIFILSGSTIAEANTYFDTHGADLGWRTNDSDNTEGALTITTSSIVRGVPHVLAIDTDTMQIAFDNPSDLATAAFLMTL